MRRDANLQSTQPRHAYLNSVDAKPHLSDFHPGQLWMLSRVLRLDFHDRAIVVERAHEKVVRLLVVSVVVLVVLHEEEVPFVLHLFKAHRHTLASYGHGCQHRLGVGLHLLFRKFMIDRVNLLLGCVWVSA